MYFIWERNKLPFSNEVASSFEFYTERRALVGNIVVVVISYIHSRPFWLFLFVFSAFSSSHTGTLHLCFVFFIYFLASIVFRL